MEDTPMIGQGLHGNWREEKDLLYGSVRIPPRVPEPKCPVCDPMSWDEALRQEREGRLPERGLMPSACPKRYRFRKREHAAYIKERRNGS